MELMVTLTAITAVTGLAALGIAVLPWSATELNESASAVDAVPEALAAAARQVRPALAERAVG